MNFSHIHTRKQVPYFLFNIGYANRTLKVRSDTAEYFYVFLQSADIGFETDAIEDILLETEWYVKFFLPLLKINPLNFIEGQQLTSKWRKKQPMRWSTILRPQWLEMQKIYNLEDKCRCTIVTVVYGVFSERNEVTMGVWNDGFDKFGRWRSRVASVYGLLSALSF